MNPAESRFCRFLIIVNVIARISIVSSIVSIRFQGMEDFIQIHKERIDMLSERSRLWKAFQKVWRDRSNSFLWQESHKKHRSVLIFLSRSAAGLAKPKAVKISTTSWVRCICIGIISVKWIGDRWSFRLAVELDPIRCCLIQMLITRSRSIAKQ